MFAVGGIEVKIPILVGAGVCKTPESVRPYMREDVSVGAVATGSYTPEARSGNEGVLAWPSDYEGFSRDGVGLNAFGMPNMGYGSAAQDLHWEYPRPVIVSAAAFSVDGFLAGVRIFDAHPGVAVSEVNAGCPNAHDKKTVPIAYDLDSQSRILEGIERYKPRKPVWLKLSPYITAAERKKLELEYPYVDFSHVPVVEPGFLGNVLELIWKYRTVVQAVVFSNTLPNVIIHGSDGKPVTTPNGGQAGLSGKILKPISMRLIRQAYKVFGGAISLIASGGAVTGDDVVDFLENDATAVYCTSGPFFYGGPRFFADMIAGSERLQTYLTDHEGGTDER